MKINQLFFAIFIISSFAYSCEKTERFAPEMTLKTIDGAFASVPADARLLVVKNLVEEDILSTCKNIRNLAQTNKSFNHLINYSAHSQGLLYYLADTFASTRLKVVLNLRTPAAVQWLKKQLNDDSGGEFEQEVIKKFLKTAPWSTAKTPTTEKIYKQTLAAYNFPQNVIDDHLRSTSRVWFFEGYKKMQFLLKYFPNLINRKNENGFTALMYAIGKTNPATTELLLSAGADVSIINDEGKNALNLAKEVKQFKEHSRYSNGSGDLEMLNAIHHEQEYLKSAAGLELIKEAHNKQTHPLCSIQ
jgi:hypothetical protein